MSDAAREQDPSLGGQAVDQASRAQQGDDDIKVTSADEVIETLRQQLTDLESRDADRERQLSAEKARALAAERARQEAENRARAADEARTTERHVGERSAAEARLDLIKNSLSMHDSQLNALATSKAGLIAEGKLDEAAQIDVQMAKIGGRIAQLEDGKLELEERIKAAPPEPQQRQETRQAPQGDPKEEFIRTQPAIVQTWLRGPNGDRFFTDTSFQNRVAAAARYAQEIRGLPIDSQSYIDFIEEDVGLRQPQQRQAPPPSTGAAADGGHRGREADASDRRMMAAPAGGATGGSVRSNGDGSTTVYLTPQEKEMAAFSGLTEAEYAKNKRDLLRENLIGPTARR